jgi:hypothetical protein
MLQQQFINMIKAPQHVAPASLAELETLVNEYPFFETAHLLYTKGLHQANAINYSRQLRKTAIVANSRTVLYELLYQHHTEAIPAEIPVKEEVKPVVVEQKAIEEKESVGKLSDQNTQKVSPVTVTSDEIKVIYVTTVTEKPLVIEKSVPEEKQLVAHPTSVLNEEAKKELDIIKDIENETEAPVQEFNEEKLNKDIDSEIKRGVIQSYVETEVIKTPELEKEGNTEPGSFTDWLHKIKKEAGSIQKPEPPKQEKPVEEKPKIEKKPTFFEQNKQIIDKIIESDPGRIKLGSNKFFTPAIDAKQSLLENEHLVTETLAKIYALQGNISKAIRAYEILSLKFPQKSVYFASLIEKLKTNK